MTTKKKFEKAHRKLLLFCSEFRAGGISGIELSVVGGVQGAAQ